MNKYLKSCSERYSKLIDKDFMLNPMSEVDCEIFIELTQVLKKAGVDDVIEIIKQYKEIKDTEIRDTLLQWNIDHPHLGVKKLINKIADKASDEIEEDENERPSYFMLGDIMIHEFTIRGLAMYERFDEESEDTIYGIVVNPMPEGLNMKQVPMFANKKIEYRNEELRKEVLTNLSNYLQSRNINTINLEGDA